MSIPLAIHNESELEEVLSRPSEADIDCLSRLPGDIVILGAGGKMGPSLARRIRRAADAASDARRVMAVARFTSAATADDLSRSAIETITSDLLLPGALGALPDAPNVIFMAARKFGTTGDEGLTWAMNVFLPGLVAERYRNARIVAFSTGNVYPLVETAHGGATEDTPVAPVGEYAQSALGRERIFEYGSSRYGTPVTLLRLNYAIDLRYGVLHDIARRVFERQPIDLAMGLVNVIWQGDANSACLRSLELCRNPPLVVNLTGPEAVSVRWLASEFGRRFGIDPIIAGTESPTALISNAARAHRLFGYPAISLGQMIEWTAEWVASGGVRWEKPTHFESREGRF